MLDIISRTQSNLRIGSKYATNVIAPNIRPKIKPPQTREFKNAYRDSVIRGGVPSGIILSKAEATYGLARSAKLAALVHAANFSCNLDCDCTTTVLVTGALATLAATAL